MARKKLPQIFAAMPFFEIAAQQALDRIGHFVRGATISDGPGKAGVLAHGAPQTEIIGVLRAAISLDLLAFQPDVGDAMLAATVGAAGNVELQLLLEPGQALFQLFHQPAREGLGFRDRQLAELAASAGHGAAPEGRSGNVKAGGFQSQRDRGSLLTQDVDDDQVLRVGGAQLAVTVALGQVGGGAQLLGRDAAAQDGSANIEQPRLLLRMNAHVITENVVRRDFRSSRIKFVAELALDGLQERFRSPAVLEEKIFQARALAVFAQDIGFAEELAHGFDHRNHLLPANESIEAHSEVRLSGKAAANADGETNFGLRFGAGGACSPP